LASFAAASKAAFVFFISAIPATRTSASEKEPWQKGGLIPYDERCDLHLTKRPAPFGAGTVFVTRDKTGELPALGRIPGINVLADLIPGDAVAFLNFAFQLV
jgi:hypothetical protein